MLKRLQSALSYSNVTATVALFIALAGTAYAAGVLPPKSVGTKQLKKDAVTSVKIKNGQVRSLDVADEALAGTDILNGSVGSFEIGDGAITGPKIAAGAVGGASLADGAITGPKIAAGAVGGASLADGAITGPKIVDGTVGSADLDPDTVGDVISNAGTFPNDGTARKVLELPGFGSLTLLCTAADSANLFYSLEIGANQNARLYGHDPLDNSPKGAVGASGELGGGIGYGGPGHAFIEGNLFVFTDDQVLQVDFSVVPGGSSCVYRIRATLDHNET